jgi:hypothetical protein
MMVDGCRVLGNLIKGIKENKLGMKIKQYTLRIFGVILLSVLMVSCASSKITCPVYPYHKNNKGAFSQKAGSRRYPSHGRIVGKKQHTGNSRKIQNSKARR